MKEASRRRKNELASQLDLELDRELEATFPASDPLKITRKGVDTRPTRSERKSTLRSS